MKCWFISLYNSSSYDDGEGDFVFADTRYQARQIGWHNFLMGADHWMHIRAVRVAALDGEPRAITDAEATRAGYRAERSRYEYAGYRGEVHWFVRALTVSHARSPAATASQPACGGTANGATS